MSTRHALAHRHDPSFAATGDRGEAHMTWLLGPSSDGCAGLYGATDGAQPVMRFGDRIRQDRPGLIAVRAAGKPDLEGDHDAGQPVTVGIAALPASARTWKLSGSARREARMSTSMRRSPQ